MRNSRAAWLKDARWGAFVHFLADPPSSMASDGLSAADWNRRVDGFDCEGLASQLETAGASYCFLTLGQNSGHFCSPNATYERLTGVQPCKCSRRDLMMDLHGSLSSRGIRLLAYLPSHAPMHDVEAVRKLKFTPPWDFSQWSPISGSYSAKDFEGVDERVSQGQRNWEAVIREWSLRWGSRVEGWWFDGVYYADKMYRRDDEPNFRSFAAAARAGNPDSCVAWNPGVLYPPVEMDSEEDYTAGEINDPFLLDHAGTWQGRETYQVLTFLGQFWCRGPVRFTSEEAALFVKEVNAYGGAVTWDLPVDEKGLIHEDCHAVLKGLEKALRALPPVPKTASVTAKPLGSCKQYSDGSSSGSEVEITLSNKWDCKVEGSVKLQSEPPDTLILQADALPYNLAPGQTEVFRLKAGLSEQAKFGQSVKLLLQTIPGQPALPVKLPMEFIFSSAVSCFDAWYKQEHCATVKLSFAGDILKMEFSVNDTRIERSGTPWAGSSIELFMAGEPGAKVRQLFLLPDDGREKAVAFCADAQKQSRAQGLTYSSRRTATGYDSEVEIPLPWCLDMDSVPDSFLLAFTFNLFNEGKALVKAQLFGNGSSHAKPDYFAHILVKQLPSS